jgi:hypothetical protein
MDFDLADAFRCPSLLRIMRRVQEGDFNLNDLVPLLQDAEFIQQLVEEVKHPEDYPITAGETEQASRFSELMNEGMNSAEYISRTRDMSREVPGLQQLTSVLDFMEEHGVRGFEGAMQGMEHLLAQVPSGNLHPATPEEIVSLPQEATLVSEEVCFCQQDREVGELYELTTLPCQHKFDTLCITQWLQRCHTCPVCRYPLLTGIARIDQEVCEEQTRRLPDPGVD